MAAINYTAISCSDNTAVQATATAIVAGNSYTVFDSTSQDDQLFFILRNDATTAVGSVVFKANSDGHAGGIGDLTVYCKGSDNDGTVAIGPLEGARFMQNDGRWKLDSSMAGELNAFRVR